MTEENWKVGDIALCVCDNWTFHGGLPQDAVTSAPRKGEYLTVERIQSFRGQAFFIFRDRNPDLGWTVKAFRKLRPDTEPAAEEDWVRQLQHLRRPVPA